MAAVAGRYARAFAEVITSRGVDPAQAVSELKEMASLVTGNSELRNILENPAVEHKQKLALLDVIFKRTGGSKLLRNFVAVLVDQKRIGQIQEIAEQFRHELNNSMGIAEAEVKSSRELSSAEKQALEKRITAVTGKRVIASYAQDPSLLGGATVRIGSTIYDGSVRGQLQKIRQRMVSS